VAGSVVVVLGFYPLITSIKVTTIYVGSTTIFTAFLRAFKSSDTE